MQELRQQETRRSGADDPDLCARPCHFRGIKCRKRPSRPYPACAVADHLADALQLRRGGRARHGERDGAAEFAGWLSMITGSLGKLGQDVALMAQTEIGELRLPGGGGSSAMPGKNNPVAAEMLVALARFNAGMIGTVHQALVHENERSCSAWTLEWMTLPQMCVATGASLRHGAALIETIAAELASRPDRAQAP
jgi:3-carboxy-cis,cis-muconate cycloisomerase